MEAWAPLCCVPDGREEDAVPRRGGGGKDHYNRGSSTINKAWVRNWHAQPTSVNSGMCATASPGLSRAACIICRRRILLIMSNADWTTSQRVCHRETLVSAAAWRSTICRGHCLLSLRCSLAPLTCRRQPQALGHHCIAPLQSLTSTSTPAGRSSCISRSMVCADTARALSGCKENVKCVNLASQSHTVQRGRRPPRVTLDKSRGRSRGDNQSDEYSDLLRTVP